MFHDGLPQLHREAPTMVKQAGLNPVFPLNCEYHRVFFLLILEYTERYKGSYLKLDNHLKELLKKLGKALHHAMADSEDVQDITRTIRNEGFNLFLVMEANIALEKKDDDLPGQVFNRLPDAGNEEKIVVKMTKFDEDFLSGMRITSKDQSEPLKTQNYDSGGD